MLGVSETFDCLYLGFDHQSGSWAVVSGRAANSSYCNQKQLGIISLGNNRLVRSVGVGKAMVHLVDLCTS